jgi:hypothetical protein
MRLLVQTQVRDKLPADRRDFGPGVSLLQRESDLFYCEFELLI